MRLPGGNAFANDRPVRPHSDLEMTLLKVRRAKVLTGLELPFGDLRLSPIRSRYRKPYGGFPMLGNRETVAIHS